MSGPGTSRETGVQVLDRDPESGIGSKVRTPGPGPGKGRTWAGNRDLDGMCT